MVLAQRTFETYNFTVKKCRNSNVIRTSRPHICSTMMRLPEQLSFLIHPVVILEWHRGRQGIDNEIREDFYPLKPNQMRIFKVFFARIKLFGLHWNIFLLPLPPLSYTAEMERKLQELIQNTWLIIYLNVLKINLKFFSTGINQYI